MLQSWTRVDFMTLVGPNINFPANAIYMTREEHGIFGKFKFYLDKDAVGRGLFILRLALTHFSIRIYPTSTDYV